MSKMIINASNPKEIRVAFVDDRLYDLEVEQLDHVSNQSDMYGGAIVTRYEPSLEAAFVDYGSDRHGFLPLRDIAPEYLEKNQNSDNGSSDKIAVGKRLIIQIEKEEQGTKGAAITTYLSLAGSYLVLMPNNPKVGGISRRIEGSERDELRDLYNQLTIPNGMGVIIRTAGLGKKLSDLQWDLDTLVNHWHTIKQASDEKAQQSKRPFLLHQDGNIVIRSIRDNLRPEISEVIIDDKDTYELVKKYLQQIKPDFDITQVKHHQEVEPIFSTHGIEREIEKTNQREVKLPSGGVIVIDRTEALVAVDINSSKATKGSDIEQTALQTNLEAADEIARQLRIRDLGGLVVIDFIDMSDSQHQRAVEQRLRQALSFDRARIQVGKISRFGLLEMSRQRLKLPLGHKSQITCPRCTGTGLIPSIEGLCTNLIRLLGQEALSDKNSCIQLYVPVEVATFLLNENRSVLAEMESKHKKTISIIPNPNLQSPQYHMKLIVDKPDEQHAVLPTTYSLISPKNFKTPKSAPQNKQGQRQQDAVVSHYLKHAESPPKQNEDGLFKKIKNIIAGDKKLEVEQPPQNKPKPRRNRKPNHARRNPKNPQRRSPQSRPQKAQGNKSGQSNHESGAKNNQRRRRQGEKTARPKKTNNSDD